MRLDQGRLLICLTALVLVLLDAPLQASQNSALSGPEESSDSAVSLGPEGESIPELSVEEILTQTADPDSYGDSPRCIATRRIRGSSVLNDQHVAFQISASKYYLVQFRNRCPMLERNATISYETRSGQLCALDSIRGLIGLGTTARFGPRCQIPGFQEITQEQLIALRRQLKEDRRRRPDLVEEPSERTGGTGAADTGEDGASS